MGPYESITLQATSGEVLTEWLSARDFDLPPDLAPALDPYLANSGYLVALRLAKESDTGDLAPLGMRYAGQVPMIPIQLTRIAATDDMRLEPYVLSTGRAVPTNYLHVELNDVAVDWFTNGSNYRSVLSKAANEAGGQAFATDFSGPTTDLRDLLASDGQADNVPARRRRRPLIVHLHLVALRRRLESSRTSQAASPSLTTCPGSLHRTSSTAPTAMRRTSTSCPRRAPRRWTSA